MHLKMMAKCLCCITILSSFQKKLYVNSLPLLERNVCFEMYTKIAPMDKNLIDEEIPLFLSTSIEVSKTRVEKSKSDYNFILTTPKAHQPKGFMTSKSFDLLLGTKNLFKITPSGEEMFSSDILMGKYRYLGLFCKKKDNIPLNISVIFLFCTAIILSAIIVLAVVYCRFVQASTEVL